MTTQMRKTGVDVVGDMPWGTHFCLFYETKADLLEISVSYCKAGLESQEFCLWVVAEPLAVRMHGVNKNKPYLTSIDTSLTIALRLFRLATGTSRMASLISTE